MDSIGLLQNVTKRDGVGGRIVEVLRDAAKLVGEDICFLENRLEEACEGAPGALARVLRHIVDSGGKHVRPVLCLLSFRACGGSGPLPMDLAATCELLHNATLLHDDVIDEGDTRRGKPTARIVYGNALSVLGGDYLLINTIETIAKRDGRFMAGYVSTLKHLVEGELIQLQRRGSVNTTEQEYFRIIEGKTANLFKWSVYSGALAAEATETVCQKMGEFGWHIGVAFQLMDDILDFTADAGLLGKNLLKDIQEGKMTLPVILAAKRSPALRDLLSELISKDPKPIVSKMIADAVVESGIINSVKEYAVDQTAKGLAALRLVNEKPNQIVEVIESLASALLVRNF
jgi:octaprenyl-diphosphate synthase